MQRTGTEKCANDHTLDQLDLTLDALHAVEGLCLRGGVVVVMSIKCTVQDGAGLGLCVGRWPDVRDLTRMERRVT